jgi:alpha-glucosidase
LPYIYTSVEEMSRTGTPLMQPIFLEYPQAEDFYGDNRDFLFGPDLFVAPVITEMVDAEDISLPPGNWYDYWTAQKHNSKEHISLHPRLDEMPLYVRAGAIIPMQPLVQSTSEKPNGPLELRVYPGENCHGSLYQDDGHSFAYEKGEFLRVNYDCQAAPNSIGITSTVDKDGFQPWWTSVQLTIFGAASEPTDVRVEHRATKDWRYDAQAHTVTINVPDAKKNWAVRVNF